MNTPRMVMTAALLLVFTISSAMAETFVSKFGSQGSLNGQFEAPTAIAVAGDGSIYVADSGNGRVQKFDSSGAFLLQILAGAPSGVAVDGLGNVYISDSEDRSVRKFDASGNFLLQIEPICSVGVGNCIDPDGTGPRPTVYSPTGVAVDLLNNVYVIGTFHLQKFNASGTLLVEFPLGGIVPRAIAVDSAGNIIIFEKDNGTINKYDAAGNILVKFGGTGTAAGQFGGDPGGLAADAAGNIYATDPANARVQKFDGAGTFLLTFGTLGSGNGQFGGPALDPLASPGPIGIAVDAFAKIYVSDTGSNRVQIFGITVTPPAAQADLSVTMSATPNPVPLGASLTFTITVANAGPSPATGVTLSDVLPANLTLSSPPTSSQGTCSANGQAISCALGTLASGGTATLAIVTTPAGAGAVTNTATVSSDVADPASANNAASAAVTIRQPGQADLRITMVASPSVVGVNPRPVNRLPPGIAPITYTIEVENLGPETASGVVVSNSLPRTVSPLFPLPRGCVKGDGVTITCDIGTLAVGQAKTVSLEATPQRLGPVTSTATVSIAAAPGAPTDPDLSTNQASATVTAVVAPADIRLRMSATPPVLDLAPGQGRPIIVYAIEVENAGPGPSDIRDDTGRNRLPTPPPGIVLTDVLPAGVTLISTDLAAQRCRLSGSTIACDVGFLAAGDVRAFTFRVAAAGIGTVTNTATVTVPSGSDIARDPDLTNNSASATVVLPDRGQADVSVRMTATPDMAVLNSPRGGGEIAYTITVVNNGPGTAGRVVLTDVLPAGVSLTAPPRIGPRGTCAVSGNAISCDVRELGKRDSARVDFTVVPAASGIVTNTASVTTTGPPGLPDPNTSNNVATTAVTVADASQADLRLQMTASPAVVTPGTKVTYTIDIDNAGPANAPVIRLVDVLPAGVTILSVSATGLRDGRPGSPCTIVGNTVSCDLGGPDARGARQSPRATIVVTAPLTAGVLTNTATVSSIATRQTGPAVGDPDLSNNSATATVTVVDLNAAAN